MTILVARQRLRVNRNGNHVTERFTIDPLTDRIRLRIGRETTGGPRSFPADSRIRTRIIIRAGAQDFICQGSATGGIHLGEQGEELIDYALQFGLPTGFFGDPARLKRLGETVGTFDAMLELLLDGRQIDTDFILESTESAAPIREFHNSVAYDAATDAVEASGDGVLSLSHTASGTDRAVFMTATSNINAVTSSSFTYAGNGSTKMWDVRGGVQNNAGHRLAGDSNIPTGSQTATSTLSGSPGVRHIIAVISMTGVDSTTPVGTHQTNTLPQGSATSLSVTVGSLDGDGLICDSINVGSGSDPNQAAGADQTQRTTELNSTSGNMRTATSTQLSADGGVMSWTFGGSQGGAAMGAVEFKPAAGGGGPISEAIGFVSETDTANSVTPVPGAISISVGAASETEAAQSVTSALEITVAVGVTSETDAAQGVTSVAGEATIAVGAASETDTAQSVSFDAGQLIGVSLASETDAAQSVAPTVGVVAVGVGGAAESEAASAVAVASEVAVGVSATSEADAAQTVSVVGSLSEEVGSAQESDAAQSVTPVPGEAPVSVGSASEVDAAQAVSLFQGLVGIVGPASESDAAQSVTPVPGETLIIVSRASETDRAYPFDFGDSSENGLSDGYLGWDGCSSFEHRGSLGREGLHENLPRI